MLAFDRFRRADEIVARKRCGNHAVHRRRANLVALVPGAIDEKLQRASRLAAGDAEGGDDPILRQTEQFCRSGRRAIRSSSRRRVKAAAIMRGRIERIAEPAADFVARDDRGQHFATGATHHFADRKCGRHHRGARMQRAIGMSIVEIERMTECAVQQRRHRRSIATRKAEHRRSPRRIEPEALEHGKQARRRIRLLAAANHTADQVDGKMLCAFGNSRWERVIS